MAHSRKTAFDAKVLLRDFRIYDRSVDIVSAYQWLFTETRELPSAVAHFERYPRIKHPDGNDATPDFTVLFTDGRAIVGEIANIALADGSVDSLCRQLGRYDGLTSVPGPEGRLVDVSRVDVLFLSPMETARDAAQRIFVDRIDNPNHDYVPSRRPFMVQFAQTPERYILQAWADPALNGRLTSGVDRGYDSFDDLKIPPDMFAHLKVKFGFCNDPVPPLYMATRLWMSVFPSTFWGARVKGEFTATRDQIARVVEEQYGRVKPTEVTAALLVLAAAGLAHETAGRWTIAHRPLKDDVAQAIIERIGTASASRTAPPSRTRGRQPTVDQGVLF